MIKEVYFENFRNLENGKVNLSPTFNLFYGKNAQGKTSLMESIYFCATGKSFRTKRYIQMIKYEKEDAKIFIKLNNFSRYSIHLLKDGKLYYKNSEKIKYKDYIGEILAISFIPEDVDLIMGNPSTRRAFFNYEIAQINKEYLLNIMEYEKVLKVRNGFLKSRDIDNDVFKIYNEKYIELCIKISKIRYEYIKSLNELLDKNYKKIFNKNHSLEIKYESFSKNLIDEEIRKNILLKEKNDLILGYSSFGIHKDDFIFLLNQKDAKHYSSQGEKKSIVFAIKISEIEYMEDKFNKKPIFLMDDLTSFFDEDRKTQIIKYFLEKKIQCFLTATEDMNLEGKKMYIDGGKICEKIR